MGAAVVLAAAAGCQPKRDGAAVVIAPPADVEGALTPERVRAVYGTPAFVVRGTVEGRHAAVQDVDLPADQPVDDTNLLIFAEGSADTVEAFRWTARLLAESPHGFPGDPHRLAVLLLKWSESSNVVAEHLNLAGQQKGAARLLAMLDVHRRRHGGAGHVALVGFSAGTRAVQLAFLGDLPPGTRAAPALLARVDHVAFLGSSMDCEDPAPFEPIRGRFINFVNPRDTHFGDRAAYAAPAGKEVAPLKLLASGTLVRRPHVGASVAGFVSLPRFTAPEQFDALEAIRDLADRARAERAFKMLNIRVPRALLAYNLFGDPVPDDDLDDYVNLAPNHFILVGRGPGGSTADAAFRQYKAPAMEFVRQHVASAALGGRLRRFDLKAKPQGANPLGVPLPVPVPWAIFKGDPKAAPPPEPADQATDEGPAPEPPVPGEPAVTP